MIEKEAQHPLPELFTTAEWRSLGRRLDLTRRQLEIARWICLGYSNSAIAKELRVAPDTVLMHTRALFQRLGIHVRVGVSVRLVLEHRRRKRSES